jgi:regulator of sirC expression with transglutaminase-like and TPR domain
MTNESEIKALFKLLDDPDQVVFDSVSSHIVSFGTGIIPSLETLWLEAENEIVQHRIESLIQQVSLTDIKKKFLAWENNTDTKESAGASSLYEAMTLLCQYIHPDLKNNVFDKTLKSIHRSCWLELNNYLTPLEEVHIVNSILYRMYKFRSEKDALKNPSTYYLCDVLDTKKGNQYSLSMLYLIITQMLDIPVYAFRVSNFVILGYINTLYHFDSTSPNTTNIQFFIEPTEGTILSKQDVESFIKKYNVQIEEDSFEPLTNKDFVYYFAQALSMAYQETKQEDRAADILSIIEHIIPNRR